MIPNRHSIYAVLDCVLGNALGEQFGGLKGHKLGTATPSLVAQVIFVTVGAINVDREAIFTTYSSSAFIDQDITARNYFAARRYWLDPRGFSSGEPLLCELCEPVKSRCPDTYEL